MTGFIFKLMPFRARLCSCVRQLRLLVVKLRTALYINNPDAKLHTWVKQCIGIQF